MWTSPVENAEQVGFVYPTENLIIGAEKLELPMSLRLKIFNNIAFHTEISDNIRTQLSSIEQIPGVRDQLTIKTETIKQIAQSNITVDSIVQKLKTIYKYESAMEKTPNDKCAAGLAHYLDLLSYSAENFIKSSVTALGSSYTVANVVPGNTADNNIVNVLTDAYTHSRSIENKDSDYLSKLEAMTSGQNFGRYIYSSEKLAMCG